MPSQPTIEALATQNEQYQLLLQVPHNNMLPMIKEELAHKTVFTRAYKNWASVVMFFAAALLTFGLFSFGFNLNFLWFLLIGFGLSLLIIVPHELIHGLGYKWLKAPKVVYGAVWKHLMFYASAPNFVATTPGFYYMALAPFVVLNCALIAGIVLLPFYWKLALSVTLILHSFACGGDFALCSYLYRHKGQVFTYDDPATQEAYFYIQKTAA